MKPLTSILSLPLRYQRIYENEFLLNIQSHMTTFKHRIESFFFKAVLFAVKYAPAWLVSKLGAALGSFCYFIGVRRSVVEKNLSVAFGDQFDEKQKKRLCRRIYKGAGSVMFEFLKLNFIAPEEVHNYVEIEGLEKLREAQKEGKGVVLGAFHFGNWELLSAGVCASISPIYAYAGRQKNQAVDKAINNIRERFGLISISKSKSAPKKMLKALKNKHILGILSDINVPHDNLFIDFFGKKAAIGPGLAVFTHKLKTPLLVLWNERTGTFKYKGYIKRIDYQLSGDPEKDIQRLAQLYSSALEDIIRKNPDHYFWFNRRWKTRPAGEEDIY